jgi:hypothetical protein
MYILLVINVLIIKTIFLENIGLLMFCVNIDYGGERAIAIFLNFFGW